MFCELCAKGVNVSLRWRWILMFIWTFFISEGRIKVFELVCPEIKPNLIVASCEGHSSFSIWNHLQLLYISLWCEESWFGYESYNTCLPEKNRWCTDFTQKGGPFVLASLSFCFDDGIWQVAISYHAIWNGSKIAVEIKIYPTFQMFWLNLNFQSCKCFRWLRKRKKNMWYSYCTLFCMKNM